MRRLQIVSLIIVGTLAISGVALANMDSSPEIKSHRSVQKSNDESTEPEQSLPKVKASETEQGDDQSDNCSKTVTENNTTSGTNVSNSKTTKVNCNVDNQNGRTSVNITNSNSQTAITGHSDGQSGTATTHDQSNTSIDVN